MTKETVRRRVHISGRVQGVGFRESCRRAANAEGVTGYVQNRADGTVTAVFEGLSDAVEKMITWCRQGPSQAHVTALYVAEEPPAGEYHEFRVT